MATYELVDSIEKATSAFSVLRRCTELNVDCEGVQLGRTGELCLLQVATPTNLDTFDVYSLRNKVIGKKIAGCRLL